MILFSADANFAIRLAGRRRIQDKAFLYIDTGSFIVTILGHPARRLAQLDGSGSFRYVWMELTFGSPFRAAERFFDGAEIDGGQHR